MRRRCPNRDERSPLPAALVDATNSKAAGRGLESGGSALLPHTRLGGVVGRVAQSFPGN